jgi:hypothetical protein
LMMASTFFTAHLVDVKVTLTLRFAPATGQGGLLGRRAPGCSNPGQPPRAAGRRRGRLIGEAGRWRFAGRGRPSMTEEAATSGPRASR